jgi:hypothetical protein
MALTAQVDTKDAGRILFSEPVTIQQATAYLWPTPPTKPDAIRPDPSEPAAGARQRGYLVNKNDSDLLFSMQHGLANVYARRIQPLQSRGRVELPPWVPPHLRDAILNNRVPNGYSNFPGTKPWGDIVVWIDRSSGYMSVQVYQEFPEGLDYYLGITGGDKREARLLRRVYTQFNKDIHDLIVHRFFTPEEARAELRKINAEVYKLILEGVLMIMGSGAGITTVGNAMRASSRQVIEAAEKTGFGRGGPPGAGGGVRVKVTEAEGAAIERLQAALLKGKNWGDLSRSDRAVLGNFFHKVVEPLTEFIFRRVGRTFRRARITSGLIQQLRQGGGRVLFEEGELVLGGRTLRVDLAEIDFATNRVTVLDLTSVDQVAHVIKTRDYRDALRNLTGFPSQAMEMRYVGQDRELLATLAEALL